MNMVYLGNGQSVIVAMVGMSGWDKMLKILTWRAKNLECNLYGMQSQD